jgi:hypothetical protein
MRIIATNRAAQTPGLKPPDPWKMVKSKSWHSNRQKTLIKDSNEVRILSQFLKTRRKILPVLTREPYTSLFHFLLN